MGLQEQPSQHVLHTAADVTLGDAPQPGVHAQGLTARHVVQEGVELRAVADPLLDLEARGTQWGLAHKQGLQAKRCLGTRRTLLHLWLNFSSEIACETRGKFPHSWSSQSGGDRHTQCALGHKLCDLMLHFPSWFLIVRGHFRWPRLTGEGKHWRVCTLPISWSPLGTRAQQKAESQGRKQEGPHFQVRSSPCSPGLTLYGADSGRGVQRLN